MNHKIRIIFAMLIFGSLGLFVTKLSIPTSQIVFIRAAQACLILFFVLVIKSKKKSEIKFKLEFKTFLLLLFLGALIGINWLLLFEAYKYTLVSTATLLYYAQPVIVILFSTLFLKEKLTKNKAIGASLAIVGMLLINGVSVGGADPKKGILLSLAAAVLYAVIILVNKLSKGISEMDGILLTDIQMLGAAITMAVYTFSDYHGELSRLDSQSIVILLILGFVHSALAYYLYFSSIKYVSAQNLAILGYIDPASALLFSALFLHEKMTLLQWIGAVLIIGGALYSQIGSEKSI